MYGYGGGYGVPHGGRGYGVDVNRDGIPDYRVKPGVGVDVNGDGYADYRTPSKVTAGPGMAYGAARPGYGVDVNGDGVADYRVKQGYGGARVVPGPGMGMGGGYGYRGY